MVTTLLVFAIIATLATGFETLSNSLNNEKPVPGVLQFVLAAFYFWAVYFLIRIAILVNNGTDLVIPGVNSW